MLHQAVPALAKATEAFSCGVRRIYSAAVYMDYTLSQMDTRCHVVDGQGSIVGDRYFIIGRNVSL